MGCSPGKAKDSKNINTPIVTDFPIRKKSSGLSPKDFIVHHSGKFKEDYEKIITIGKGGYGEVQKVQNKKTGLFRAAKIIKKQEGTPEEAEKVFKESNVLSKLDHPGILKLHETYEDMAFYYFVTEYLEGGEVLSALSKQMTFTEQVTATIMQQVLYAVNYCHKNGIVHRDLKLQNVMYEFDSSDSPVKLIDFGVATEFYPQTPITEALGTANYIAPEVIKKNYDEKCDIWSCGVMTYIMLNGAPPFNGRDNNETVEMILGGKFRLDTQGLKKVSNQGIDFIKRLLTLDPQKRPNAEQALADPWFKTLGEKANVNEPKYAGILECLKSYKVRKESILES